MPWIPFSRERDKSLLQACSEGRTEAFEKLVERYQPVVIRHVTYMLHQYGCGRMIPGHRDEIIQQIWTGLIEQIAKFPADEFPSWFSLYRRWKTLDYLRKEFRYLDRHVGGVEDGVRRPEEWNGNPERQNPENLVANKQEHLRVLVCLEKIPRKYRDFIRLYYFKGWSYGQIASHYEIGVGSVGSLHTRAVRKLRKVVQKNKLSKK